MKHCQPIAFAVLALCWTGQVYGDAAQGAASLPAEKRIVETASATIAYVETGDPDGRALVFVHGLPFSSFIWRDVMPAIEAEGYRSIAVDLVGFGDSSGEGYGVLDQVNHLDSFIDALALDHVTFMTHDWGAGIALIWASQNRDRVAGFATMEGAMPPIYPRPAYDEMPDRIANMFRSMREDEAETNVLENNLWLETIMPSMTGEPLPEAVVAEYHRPFPDAESRRPLLEMSRSLPIGGEPTDVTAAYSDAVAWWTESATPKLILYAEPGRLLRREQAEWSAENAVNVTVSRIGEGNHAVQEENPAAVAAGLDRWLATLGEPVGN